jgi:hypothetical protein
VLRLDSSQEIGDPKAITRPVIWTVRVVAFLFLEIGRTS